MHLSCEVRVGTITIFLVVGDIFAVVHIDLMIVITLLQMSWEIFFWKYMTLSIVW